MLPSWVKHRDGRLAPLDLDVISHDLFAAAQSLGDVDAFLIRELTDGVVHFLAQEDLGDVADSSRVDEIVEKVVRELGQPILATAFALRPSPTSPAADFDRPPLTIAFAPTDHPDAVANRCREAFALRSVFAPDVAAAHEQGLICLGGLREPHLLDTIILDAGGSEVRDFFDAGWDLIASGARRAGKTLILDGPEWLFADHRADAINAFVRGLDRSAQAHGRSVEIHLNTMAPPPRAETRSIGPLFVPSHAAPATMPSAWLPAVMSASPNVRLAWHWHTHAQADSPNVEFIAQSTRHWDVLFDRPTKLIVLKSGLDRRHSGVLLGVGLNLPRLLNRPDVSCQGDVFLEKLPSLVRLAVSAGTQKRAYLRRHADDLNREFLLDRSAIHIELQGLAIVLQQLLGLRSVLTKPAQAFVRKLLQTVRKPLEEAERRGKHIFLPTDSDLPAAIDLPSELILIGELLPGSFLRIEQAGESSRDASAFLQFVCDRTSLGGMSLSADPGVLSPRPTPLADAL